MKHTPTPYRLITEKYPVLNEDKIVLKEGIGILANERIATVTGPNLDDWTAEQIRSDAAFIVHACNQYEDQRGMLKLIRDRMLKIAPANMLSEEKVLSMLEEVLAKAEVK